MLNVAPQIYDELSTIGLPVQPEGSVTKEVVYPCITYRGDNDIQDLTGDTLGYSNVYYTVKVWGNRLADILTNSLKVDAVMRKLGFRRIATNELWADDLGQKILRYRALGLEDFMEE